MSAITCPDCQHQFEFDTDRGFVFCEHCGRKIDLAPKAEAQPENTRSDLSAAPVNTQPAAEQPVTEKIDGEDRGFAVPVPVPETVHQPAPIQPVQPPVQQNVPVQPVQSAHAFVPPVNNRNIPEKLEAEANLSTAIKCYNARDYKTANECLKLLKESEPENFEVWFCACKVLAAEKPGDIRYALDAYIEAAANCLNYAPEGTEVKGNLTIEYNKFLKNITDAITYDYLYFAPYDRSVMSENIPSLKYQPLMKVDEYYFTIMDNIKAFQERVNPNYATNYFLGLWDNCFFCFAQEITARMVGDFNSSKLFAWYKGEMNNRVTNEAVFNAFLDLLYGYKNVFINLFNRLPYKDAKTKAVNRIAYINKWLLKLRRTDPTGRVYLFVADPNQRAALEQEIRNYKIMLSRS